MRTIQRCLSTSANGGRSIIRQKREAPRSQPFETHLNAATARQREVTKETSSRGLSPSFVAAKGQRRSAFESKVQPIRKPRKVDAFDQSPLKIVRGRINRKETYSESIGGSIAVTMSATAMHRKSRASSRNNLVQGESVVKNPSSLSIPIVSSKMANEAEIVPDSKESVNEIATNKTTRTTNPGSSMAPVAGGLVSAIGLLGYFSL